MGAWARKRERPCSNMDHARSLAGSQASPFAVSATPPFRSISFIRLIREKTVITRLHRQRVPHRWSNLRQFHAEGCTLAGTAFYRDRAVMLIDDPLSNGQTKSVACLLLAPRFVHAIKALEDFALLVLWNPNPSVLDGDDGNLIPGIQREGNRTGRRAVLKRIVQK